jgi:hypothetical protein
MSLRSLAMRSELLTLSGISHLTEHDGYFVQSTPTEPDFWMGNQLIMSDVILSAPETFSIFEKHFPDASNRSVVWDIPNLDPLKLRGVGDLGYTLDVFDRMTLQGSLPDAVMPDGVSVRA